MIITYDGTRYYGWEHQPTTDMTIQGNSRRFIHLKTAKNLRAQELYCLPEVLGFKEKLLYGAVGAAGWL